VGNSRSSSVKRLEVGPRVSGLVGNFIPNNDNSKRRQLRERWFGYIISAGGTNKYLVQFDNGEEKECALSLLKKERLTASVPPVIHVAARPADENAPAIEDVVENKELENQEEEEHLPDTIPDCDEEEVEQENNNQENIPPGVDQPENIPRDGPPPEVPNAVPAVVDPDGRMPG